MTLHPLVSEWATELAQHLGRSEAEIRQNGLSASDFGPGQAVKVKFPDKSFMKFNYSFVLISKNKSKVAIFTEHCGYIVLPLTADMAVIQIHEQVYYKE